MKYVNELLRRDCASDIIPLFTRTSNPAKEITESIAAYRHIERAMTAEGLSLENAFNLHLGDGSTCRTGALFSYMSKSYNISIDPVINLKTMEKWEKEFKPQRFGYYKKKWEDVEEFKIPGTCEVHNIVLVHSHVGTLDIMKTFSKWKFCYVNPCCEKNRQLLSTKQMEENDISVVTDGNDTHMLTAENYIIVYRNEKENK